jgi:hypothetical protein
MDGADRTRAKLDKAGQHIHRHRRINACAANLRNRVNHEATGDLLEAMIRNGLESGSGDERVPASEADPGAQDSNGNLSRLGARVPQGQPQRHAIIAEFFDRIVVLIAEGPWGYTNGLRDRCCRNFYGNRDGRRRL